jgi:hypothetical protein
MPSVPPVDKILCFFSHCFLSYSILPALLKSIGAKEIWERKPIYERDEFELAYYNLKDLLDNLDITSTITETGPEEIIIGVPGFSYFGNHSKRTMLEAIQAIINKAVYFVPTQDFDTKEYIAFMLNNCVHPRFSSECDKTRCDTCKLLIEIIKNRCTTACTLTQDKSTAIGHHSHCGALNSIASYSIYEKGHCIKELINKYFPDTTTPEILEQHIFEYNKQICITNADNIPQFLEDLKKITSDKEWYNHKLRTMMATSIDCTHCSVISKIFGLYTE